MKVYYQPYYENTTFDPKFTGKDQILMMKILFEEEQELEPVVIPPKHWTGVTS